MMAKDLGTQEMRRTIRYVMFGALLVLFIALAVLLLGGKNASAACSQPTPPIPSGDWNIGALDNCTLSGGSYTVNGNLIIQGNLTANGATIRMAGSWDGERTIEVRSGGIFNVRASSVITSTGNHYKFIAKSGSTLDIAGSTVSECGFGPGLDDLGLKVETSSATITGSFFLDDYVGIVIRTGSPKISNSKFYNDRFGVIVLDGGSPVISNSDIYNNGDGLLSLEARPTVQTSRIYGNGNSGVEFVKSDGTLSDSEVHDNHDGVVVRTSSPTISGNDIYSNRDGIRAVYGDPIIDNNQILSNRRHAIYAAETGGRIKDNDITGPAVWNLEFGSGIVLDGAKTSVIGNNLHELNNSLRGIDIRPGSDVEISNNTIQSCDACYLINSRASHFIIDGNNISFGYYGMSLSSDSGYIRNNTFYANRIAVYGGFLNTSLVFEGNRFLNNEMRAISLFSSKMMIKGNTFDSNPVGVRAFNSDATVIGNTFINNTIGMNISEGSNLYFADNTVMHGNYTIFAVRSSGTLVNNTVSYSAEHSIYFINSSYGLLINNTILGNNGRGVYFIASEGDFSGNVFSESGTGVYGAAAANLRLTNNTFQNNSVGVYVDSSILTMTGDHVRDSSTYGIYGTNSNIRIDGVDVERSKEGIYLAKTVLYMTGTTISNGTKGITLADGKNIQVVSSTFKDVSEAGIYGFDATITVDLSMFLNDSYGIKMFRSMPTVKNTMFEKGNEGIHLEESLLKLDGCRFSNQNTSAIKVSDTDTSIEDSSFLGNRNGVVQLNNALNVERSEFLNNKDMGILVTNARLEVRDTRFINNTDGVFDGGLSVINIYDCNMSANRVYGLYSSNSTISSNMTYSRMMFLQDNAFLIKGTFKVVKNGNVELNRAQLDFNPVSAGEAGVVVERGGHLKVLQTIISAQRVGVGYYFVAQDGSELVMVDSYIRDCGRGMATATGLTINTSTNLIRGTLFENNSIGLLVTNVDVNASELRFETNVIGLKAVYGRVKLVNSTFNGSSEDDIVIEQSTVHLINSIISQSASKVEIGETGCLLDVAWYVNVSVVWKDGQPVQGAQVAIKETEGSVIGAKVDEQGNVWWLVVREYQRTGPGANAYHFYSPVLANASASGISVEKSVEITSSQTIMLVLIDEEPPAILITMPSDGSVVYDNEVLVMGTAEDIGSTVDSVWVSLDGMIWLPANGTNAWSTHLTMSAGVKNLYAKAIDSRGNVRTTNITIEVDPDSPILEVWTPEDGNVTLYSSTIVTGRVHVGSKVTINGEDASLSHNGTFMLSVMLHEGENIITVHCEKGLEKKEVRLTVFMDTTPPPITVVSPAPASLVNNASVTVTVRSNEDVTFFFGDKRVESYGFEGVMVLDLKEGANTVWVRAVDKVGNENQVNFTVIVDSIKPNILVELPSEPVSRTTSKDTIIRGRTEPGVLLMVNDQVVQVGNDGTFEATIDLGMGSNKVSIVARDSANNTNEAMLQIERAKKPEDMSKYIPFLIFALIAAVCMDAGTFAYYHNKKKKQPELARAIKEAEEEEEAERAAAASAPKGEERAVRRTEDKGFYGREAKSLDQFQQRGRPPVRGDSRKQQPQAPAGPPPRPEAPPRGPPSRGPPPPPRARPGQVPQRGAGPARPPAREYFGERNEKTASQRRPMDRRRGR